MNSEELYSEILEISEKNIIKTPHVVGGIPRDLIISGRSADNKDIDITTNFSDVTRLAILFAESSNFRFRMFKDGHVSVFLNNYAVDFSSNFISDDAVEYSKSIIKNDESLKEAYSRDFTINTLLINLETNALLDPTNRGFDDIESRIIKTIVVPEITFNDDPNRIFRSIELATRLGFEVDSDIIDFVRKNKNTIKNEFEIKEAFIENIVSRSITSDPERTLELLVDMDLFDLVPLSGAFKTELISRKMIKKYLDLNDSGY